MKVLDLFAGIGGFSLGLERAGFETVAFCEIEPYAQKVLAKNFPGVKIYNNVEQLSYERLAADGIIPDVITGGFPCQDISLAGKGAGLAGERSGLWFELLRIIREIRPSYAIMENVAALLGRGLSDVLSGLAQIGYSAEWHCIPASSIGAWHKRDRVWIVAYPDRGNSRQGGYRESERAKSCCGRKTELANTSGERRQKNGKAGQRFKKRITGSGTAFQTKGPDFSRATIVGSQGRSESGGDQKKSSQIVTRCQLIRAYQGNGANGGVWSTEPGVGRVANGVSARVDRLRCLGNAVVPQIPELIGRAIQEREGSKERYKPND